MKTPGVLTVATLLFFLACPGCGGKAENTIATSKEDRLKYIEMLDGMEKTIETEQAAAEKAKTGR